MPRYRKQRGRMSRRTRRAVLDVTTKKKQDNMMIETNVTVDNPSATLSSQNPAVLRGNFIGVGVPDDPTNTNILDRTCYAFLWCATARGFSDGASDLGVRSSLNPYMVGLRENIEIQTNNGTPWQWRRICFRSKRDMAVQLGLGATTKYYTPLSDGSARRTVKTLSGNRNAGEQYALFELLFQGQNATDWVDPMVAKMDTTRFSVESDTIKTIGTGNESGMIRKYKRWYPMRKTLVYNGDESSGKMVSGNFSTWDPPGMGDYYVVDLFRARYGAGASSVLTFSPQATLYWHER